MLDMTTLSLQEQREIIRLIHLHDVPRIEINLWWVYRPRNLSLFSQKVRSWVQQFKEGRKACDNEPKQPRPHTIRTDNMAVFWDIYGEILTHCVPMYIMVTSASYQEVLKIKLLPTLLEKNTIWGERDAIVSPWKLLWSDFLCLLLSSPDS